MTYAEWLEFYAARPGPDRRMNGRGPDGGGKWDIRTYDHPTRRSHPTADPGYDRLTFGRRIGLGALRSFFFF